VDTTQAGSLSYINSPECGAMSEKPADEGDHDHEDESEWDITLNGPRLALQAAAA
jgi:hypothetical protein